MLLANQTDADVAAYADRADMTPHTRRTIVDPGKLVDEVRRVRENGWAIDDEENEPGVVCLAAPVASLDGVHHAISVSVLAMDMSLRELVAHARDIRAAAGVISARLGAVTPMAPSAPRRPLPES